tara:strand:+ start:682 stop:1641 length:960 start_codon:yes stop_codon:yes gene_type:complete
MAIIGSKKPVIKKSDLNKLIVNSNNKLKNRNISLKSKNSELEKDIKLKESELFDLIAGKKSSIESLDKEIKSYESVKIEAYNKATDASNKLAVINSDVNTLTEKEAGLLKDIDKLYIENAKQGKLLSNTENALQKAKDNKKEVASELKESKKALSDAKEEYNSFMKSIEDKGHEANLELKEKHALIDSLGLELENLNQESISLSLENKGLKESIKDIESQISDKVKSADKEISTRKENADKALNLKRAELKKVTQILERNQKLLVDVENELNNSDAKLSKTKERFQAFKVSALESVAKMKLKGKIDTIDKAGLKDILGE